MPPQGFTREKIREIFATPDVNSPIQTPRPGILPDPNDETVNVTGDLSSPMTTDEPIGSASAQDIADDVMDRRRMGELYQPDTRASDQFNRLLQEFPVRQKPSLTRRIGAGLTYLHDPKQAEIVRNRPNLEAREDWEALIKPTGEAAQTERLANVNLRTMANQIITAERSERNLARQIREGEVRARQGDERLKLDAERLAQQRRFQDESLKIRARVANGERFQLNKSTGQAFMVNRDGVPVHVPELDEFDMREKLTLEQEFAIARIEKGAQERADVRPPSVQTITDPDDPTGMRTILAQWNPATNKWEKAQISGGGTITPRPRQSTLEQQRGYEIRAQALKNQNSVLGRFVQTKNGRFVGIKPPGNAVGTYLGMSPTQAQHDEAGRIIYGPDWPRFRQTIQAPANTPPAAQVPGVPREGGGDKVIITNDGGKTKRMYPRGQPLPQGWTLAPGQ